MTSNNAIVAAATQYAFESDGSVVVGGRLGGLWVYPNGETFPVSKTPGTPGYPAYTDAAYLAVAQRAAADFLAAH